MTRTWEPITIVTVAIITALVIGIPLERSRDVSSVIDFLVPFGSAVGIFAILAIGLNVQWGYTGVFNFGIAGFFMVGAYTAAIFVKDPAAGGASPFGASADSGAGAGISVPGRGSDENAAAGGGASAASLIPLSTNGSAPSGAGALVEKPESCSSANERGGSSACTSCGGGES